MHDEDNSANVERGQSRDMEGEVWLGAYARTVLLSTLLRIGRTRS
jgi:hypothetical protein